MEALTTQSKDKLSLSFLKHKFSHYNQNKPTCKFDIEKTPLLKSQNNNENLTFMSKKQTSNILQSQFQELL
ncbi:hypothetical protein A6D98_05685 [Aliivibrio fischeri]|nr:hypothetical protein A6D98_05685 [Aliivibrio fischeri]